jgi:hypothetical protein
MIWNAAARVLLDDPRDAVWAMVSPIFLGPETIAELDGREEVAVRDYLHTVARPGVLVWKQLRALFDD